MIRNVCLVVFVAAGLTTAASASVAAQILGLVNTGADSNADGYDDNYSLSGFGDNSADGSAKVVTSSSGYPFGQWIPGDSTSRWITPYLSSTGLPLSAPQNTNYTYSLAFTLPDFADASFSARLLSDNSVASLTLNGSTLSLSGVSGQPFNNWQTFSASSGFLQGLNTLVFNVNNAAGAAPNNPTGLRVEFSQSSVSPVPEPHEWAMLLAGLGMVGTITWRRRSARR